MRNFTVHWLVVLIVGNISACAGITEIQDATVRFSQGAHAAADAEASFLSAALVVDCEDQFYSNSAAFALGKARNFDLTGRCTPRDITAAQVSTRNAMLSALALYADKMQALASSDDDKKLDSNSQDLAKSLNQTVKAAGIQLKNASLVAGVQAAFTKIAEMVLDQKKFDTTKQAASAMQDQIANIVEALKSENSSLSTAMWASMGSIEGKIKEVVGATKAAQGALATDVFYGIMNGRNIIMAGNPLAKEAFVKPNGDPEPGPADLAVPVNRALDALVNANKAIATAGTGGIRAAVNDLQRRASDAQALFKALQTAK